MTNLLFVLLIAFLILTLVSPFLPLYLMWRAAILAVIALVVFRLLQAPVPEAVEAWELVPVLGFFGIVLVIRLGIATYFDWLSWDVLVGERTAWVDIPLLIALGMIGGVALTIFLSYLLGGSAGGRALDLSIGMVAAASALCVFYVARHHLAFAMPLGTALLGLATISFGWSGQSLRIVEEAEKLAQGRPWCISIPMWPKRQGTSADLGFFSLPKQHGRPYIAFAGDGRVETWARWSIRRQRFVERKRDWAACEPQADFKARLN